MRKKWKKQLRRKIGRKTMTDKKNKWAVAMGKDAFDLADNE